MKPLHLLSLAAAVIGITAAGLTTANTPPPQVTDASGRTYVLRAGDPSLTAWRLPDVPHPADNSPTADRWPWATSSSSTRACPATAT